jgi:hypothetical protein
MDWIGVVAMLAGLAWTGGFAFAHFRAVGQAKAAESWPSAVGKVISAEVVVEESRDSDGNSSTWYNPVVAYTYSAGRGEVEGRRLRFGNPRSTSRAKAEAALAPYRAGAPVTVRYNPEKPGESVLETRKPGPIYLVLAPFGLLFVGFGLFWSSIA